MVASDEGRGARGQRGGRSAAIWALGPFGRWAALAVLLASVGLGGCGGDGGTGTPEVTAVVVSGGPVALVGVGAGVTAGVTARAVGAKGQSVDVPITWTSSAPTVATVSAGAGGTTATVTAVGRGAATLTASAGGRSAELAVTVTAACRAIQLGTSALTVTANDSGTVSGQAPCDPGLAPGVTWTALTPTLVRVSASGGYRALRRGAAVLQATASDGQQTATLSVRVNGPSGVTVQAPAFGVLVPGQTVALEATLTGDPGATGSVGWLSRAPGVATVSASGRVTAVAGAATATWVVARAELDTLVADSVEVRVRALAVAAVQIVGPDSLAPTVRGTLRAAVTGEAGVDTTVSWASLEPGVATVTATGGSTAEVTGVVVGSARIVATARGDATKRDTLVVRVRPALTGVTVAPKQLTVAVGQAGTLTAQAVAFPGLTPTVAWTSRSPSVVTVDAATGGATGVAVGGPVWVVATASVGSERQADSAAVTVANVGATIEAVRGPGGGAADLTDVQGTLAVDVGVAVPGGTVADTVVLLLGTTEVGRQQRVGPGRQTFVVATAAWDAGTGAPAFRNGITTLGTRLHFSGATVRGGPLALALRNPDVLVAQPVTPVAGAPSVTATATAYGTGWTRGPVTVSVGHVAYSGQGFDSVVVATSCGGVALAPGAPGAPGSGGPRYVGAAACANQEGAREVLPTGALGYRGGTGTALGYANYQTVSEAAGRQVGWNVDTKAPTLALSAALQSPGYWVGAATLLGEGVTASDGGAGLAGAPEVRDGATDAVKGSGADYADSPTSSAYRVYATVADRLGNAARTPNSQLFGVDKTPPEVRYSGTLTFAPGADTTSGGGYDETQYRDLQSGLPAQPESYSHLYFSGPVGGGTGCYTGALVGKGLSAQCGFTRMGGGPFAGGSVWQTGYGYYVSTGNDGPGYYVLKSFVTDNAGNRSATLVRKVYVGGPSSMDNVTFPANLGTTTNVTISIYVFGDYGEIGETDFAMDYNGLLVSYPTWRRTWGYKWDDSFLQGLSDNLTYAHGFIRSIESVNASHVLPSNATGAPPVAGVLGVREVGEARYQLAFQPVVTVGPGLYTAAGLRTFRRLGTSGAQLELTGTTAAAPPIQRIELFEVATGYTGPAAFAPSSTAGAGPGLTAWRWTTLTCTAGRSYFAVGVTAVGDGIATQPFVC